MSGKTRSRTHLRYSGSKNALLPLLEQPLSNTRIVVEPFAGSLAYGLNWIKQAEPGRRRLRAYEANPLVRLLWRWLRDEATEKRLRHLPAFRPKHKVHFSELRCSDPSDRLCPAEQVLVRLTASGSYTGQLCSALIYPQHSWDFTRLIELLPHARSGIESVGKSYERSLDWARTLTRSQRHRTFWFIDPPYLGTEGHYRYKDIRGNTVDLTTSVDPVRVQRFVKQLISLECPGIITYGDGAEQLMPSLPWQLVTTRSVALIRTGGSKLRGEWGARF